MPSSRERECSCVGLPPYSPFIMPLSLALGPTTASFLMFLLRGRTPLFLSRTIDWRAASTASWSFFSLLIMSSPKLAQGSISAGSNIPSSKRPLRTRRRATSISASLILPSSRPLVSDMNDLPHSRSVPDRTASTDALSASGCVPCWLRL